MDIATSATFCVRPTDSETDGINVEVTTDSVTIEYAYTYENKTQLRRVDMTHDEFDKLAACLDAYRTGSLEMHKRMKAV